LTFDVTAAATLVLSGTVTDAASRAAVAGATVTATTATGTSRSGTTDSSGRYAIAGLPGGTIELAVSATGYATAMRTLNLLGDTTADFMVSRSLPCPSIGFDGVGSHGAPFMVYASCGFTVRATTSNWTVSTSYGHPAPFIQFTSGAGSTSNGEVVVSAAGATFSFQSVDLYSSTTPIPYVITGIANSTVVFTIQGTLGNTFGNFAAVTNPDPSILVDALVIRLTNPAASCCSNPMGLDNIRVAQ
jgi:hypothetical protein